ncbi:MAG: peptide transporter [Lachnospiraceae bacterium]|nr:peptide transporter [Lachnospiraceae bacterium]
MTSFIRLTDFSKEELFEIFKIADSIENYSDFLKGKTVIMFFPASSIRTRVTFEKGIYLLGGQVILFDPATLDKKEDVADVCGYLNNWADAVVVRYKDIQMLEKMKNAMDIPVINALTDDNHPCEIMADLYTLSKIRKDFLNDKYLFVGEDGNIGRAWKEGSQAFDFSLSQCCPHKYKMKDVPYIADLKEAVYGKDIICTDSIPGDDIEAFKPYQVTKGIMALANKNALLNPCPPFYRGEEVSVDVIDSEYFVGYEFKKNLLVVQQAIMIYCMTHR